MVNIAIVEDDIREADIIEKFINEYGNSNNKTFNIERFENAVSLLENYRHIYDIIFMDIMMPQLDGMKAAIKLREVDKVVTLIFITNMAKYAVQGYEVDALDFIVKPVGYSTFAMKLRKALAKIDSNTVFDIEVSQKGKKIFLSTKNVIFIEISGHKVKYHLGDEIVEGYGTLSNIEKQLQSHNFLRCNSCYLINPKYITSVQGHTVAMSSGKELLISHPRKKLFMQQLADWLGEGKDI